MTAYQEIQAIVNDFFKGDAEKIKLWWNTKNPFLGDFSPKAFLGMRETEKLLKIIKNWQAEEFP